MLEIETAKNRVLLLMHKLLISRDEHSDKSYNRFVILTLTLVSISARVVVLSVVGFDNTWGGDSNWTMEADSHQYISLAEYLSDGRQDSASFRLPAYSILMNLTKIKDLPFMGILLANQVMAFTAGILIYKALGLKSRNLASASYGFVILFFPYVCFSFKVIHDIMSFLVMSLTFLVFMRLKDNQGAAWVISMNSILGLLLSIGILVKPVMQFGVVPFAVDLPPENRSRCNVSEDQTGVEDGSEAIHGGADHHEAS
ncbi:MAG: hypothetical protein GYA36_18095 [Veillonellaceae bacterium]|nr:hypothetical protein [Veillonellaceae bacterium]